MQQLELFPEPTDRKIEKLKDSQDKLRKKLFAENNMLKKEVRELKSELEFLKANICKGLLL